jgi:hypothetical protein
MASSDDTKDFDAMVDQALDGFFDDDLVDRQGKKRKKRGGHEESSGSESTLEPSFENAVDTLFKTGGTDVFGRSAVTSGDPDTDREIDLAVETLFVEEPETAPPDTAELEAQVVSGPSFEDKVLGKLALADIDWSDPTAAQAARARPQLPPSADSPSYDRAMAQEVQKNLDSVYKAGTQHEAQVADEALSARTATSIMAASPLRTLQEAILTLEWEISKRSVTTLAQELRGLRFKYRDNVTVDFAAISMRVVLDYIVKRMSKAHPESIRFLLEMTDFLDSSLSLSESDPLQSFHEILIRYERYKSVIRRAEGLPDPKPDISKRLEIQDPEAFLRLVENRAKTLVSAGRSLARGLPSTGDPENLIRSFRFLVNRAVNQILENTHGNSLQRVSRPSRTRKKSPSKW